MNDENKKNNAPPRFKVVFNWRMFLTMQENSKKEFSAQKIVSNNFLVFKTTTY